MIDKVQESNDRRMKEELSKVSTSYEKEYSELKALYDQDQIEILNLRESVETLS